MMGSIAKLTSLSRLAKRPSPFLNRSFVELLGHRSTAMQQNISLLPNAPRNSRYCMKLHQLSHYSTSSTDLSDKPSAKGELPKRKSMVREIREHAAMMEDGSAFRLSDSSLIAATDSGVFPRIKTTSLSTKRIVIQDEAARYPITLILVAFRNVADDQLAPWREAFVSNFQQHGRWFDVTINESFASRAFSGFVQQWQRARTNSALHDYIVAFNSPAREPLEDLLLTSNRMFGNILLLDRQARVRFRAAGSPTPGNLQTFITCARQLVLEDEKQSQLQ